MKLADKYEIRVVWSEKDQLFIGIAPELGYISADGQTMEEALQATKEAVAVTVEIMQENGEPLPEPKGFVVPEIPVAWPGAKVEWPASAKSQPA